MLKREKILSELKLGLDNNQKYKYNKDKELIDMNKLNWDSKMYYSAIITYFGGQTRGYTIGVDHEENPMEKLMQTIDLKNVCKIELTMIITENDMII